MNCEEKCRYLSQRKAMEAIRKRQRDNRTLELRAYRCPHCGYWHMTSKPDRFLEEGA